MNSPEEHEDIQQLLGTLSRKKDSVDL